MIEDLHVHSTMSDGSDTFEQVLEQAAQRGVERLAFTNHDTTAGLTAARELGERLRLEQGEFIAANIIEHELRKWLREEDRAPDPVLEHNHAEPPAGPPD